MSDETRDRGIEYDESGGPQIDIEPGTTDLGDDVYRGETNRGSTLGTSGGTGIEGDLDPGNNDLGDDVNRDSGNQGSVLGRSTGKSKLDPERIDWGEDQPTP